MKYLLDAVVILIFLLCVLIGSKRGFIKTVSGVVALIAGLAVSSLFCGPIAEFVYDKTIEPSIVETVDTQFEQAEATASQRLDDAYRSLSPIVKNMLAQAGIEDADDLSVHLSVEGGQSMGQSFSAVIEPILVPLLRAVCSLLLFFVTYIVAGILLRVLNVVAKLPLLKQVNKTLGLIGGAIAGVLWVLVVVAVIQVVAALGVADGVINLQTVNETTLVRWLCDITPIGGAVIDVLNGTIIE